jgi:large subunit ribosomal protein L24
MNKKLKLKKGYKVIVITGKDKGKTGDIVKVLPAENKVIVSGINVAKKHTKPSKTSKGGIVEKNMPLHISNVAYLDPKENKPSRIGCKILENGEKKRFAIRSGEIIG